MIKFRRKKRFWALLLSGALFVTQLPALAAAKDSTPEDKVDFAAVEREEGLDGRDSGEEATEGNGADTMDPPAENQPEEMLPSTKTIVGWTFTDDDNLTEGALSLPGVSKDHPADFDAVVSMLPTQISAEIDGGTNPAALDITGWSCGEYAKDGEGNWPLSGEYIFKAELPEGYVCEPPPSVKVTLCGISLLTINDRHEADGLLYDKDIPTASWNGRDNVLSAVIETVERNTTVNMSWDIDKEKVAIIKDGVIVDVPDNSVINNYGTIENYGTISGSGSIINNGTINDHSNGITVTVTGTRVNRPSQVQITFSDSKNDQITEAGYGDTIKITATAQPKTKRAGYKSAAMGQVDFYIGGTSPEQMLGTAGVSVNGGTAAATLEVPLGDAWNKGFVFGENTIIADFGGSDGLFLGSRGDAVLTVKAVPALSLTATPAGSLTLPGKVTLTAVLSGVHPDQEGEIITFTVNGTNHIVHADASGTAVCSISNPPPGTYNFGAFYEGNDCNKSVEAVPINGYTVGLETQEALVLNGLGNAYTYGDARFTLSTSGGSGSGKVSYTSSDPFVAGVEGDKVTIHKAGTFTITAVKDADSQYKEETVTSGLVTVREAAPNISLAAAGGSTTTDPLILTAAVPKVGTGAMPTGTVTFSDGSTIIAANVPLNRSGEASYTVSRPAAGKHNYKAEYFGQAGYYSGASTTRTIGVGLSSQTGFSITDPGAKTYGDSGFTLEATGGQSMGGVRFSVPDGNGVLAVEAGGGTKILGAGSVTVTAIKAGDSTYDEAISTRDITVASRDISNVTVNITGSRVYTGNQLKPVFEVEDGSLAITPGDYTNNYGDNLHAGTGTGSITLTGQHNYHGTKDVQFDIEKRPLTDAAITLESLSYPYTGKEIEPAVTKVVADGITVPDTAYEAAYADNTNVGTATVTVTAKAGSNFSGSAGTSFEITGPGEDSSYTRQTLSDPSGVTVSGQFTSGARMSVKEIALHDKGTCDACDDIRQRQEKGELIVSFDIRLASGKYTGDLVVEIPVGGQYNGQTISLLHCKGKNLESPSAKVANGMAKGTFSGLSPFAAAKAGMDAGPQKGSAASLPTGDFTHPVHWLVLMLASLAGGSGIIVIRKRRAKRHWNEF